MVVDDVFVSIFTEFSQIWYIECFIVADFCIFQISTYVLRQSGSDCQSL